MITSFKSLGQSGGGGGGYVLPTATANRLGGVKIGEGINVENDGTISVSGVDVEQNFVIIQPNEDVEKENGKLYAQMVEGETEEEWADGSNDLYLKNNGAMATFFPSDSSNYEFNPFFSFGNKRYIDVFVNSNNGLSVNYYDNGNNYVIQNEPLNVNEVNTFELPSRTFVGTASESIDFSGCSLDVYIADYGDGNVSGFVGLRPNETVIAYSFGADYTKKVDYETVLQRMFVRLREWTYNTNISDQSCYTIGYNGNVLSKLYVYDGKGDDIVTLEKNGAPKLFSQNAFSSYEINQGDVFAWGDIHTYPRCQIEDNNMDTLSVGGYAIGNEEKLYVWSEMADDKLVLQYGDYYGYKLYIYGGQDQHFRFETYLGDNMVDNGDIYQGETGTTEFTNEGVIFNLNFEGECLEITISTPQVVPFTVFYNQEHKEMFLNEGPLMGKESGERAALDSWDDSSYGNNNRHIVFLYYGELPQNEILFKVHHNQWNNDTYWSWDGEKLCSWNDENMSDRNTANDMAINSFNYNTFYMWNFTEGVLSIASRELVDIWGLYGDWYEYNEMTYEPIDWQNKVNNIKSFALPLAYGKINGVAFLGAGDIDLNGVPNGGSVGQVLKKANDGFAWSDLTKDLQVVDSLPPFADEGSVAIVNGGISYTPSNAFLAMNTTDPNGKNNFDNNTEISHIGNGNYIYFDCNGELTTSTAKTFLFRIAMRTNENDDWNASNLAYINVYREYDSVSTEHFYSWEMPPFDYYDDQGNDFTYSDSGTVDSSTTANTTSYLPLWRWWDGTYGYKFYFEYDNVADTLKTYLYHSSIDPIQGENYGDVNWECRNHTKEFCEFDTDPALSDVYVFKGGVWYKLGDLTSNI